jgi:hypothetical protein
MAELADRVFYFYDMQGAGLSRGRSISEELASQTTREPSNEWPWWCDRGPAYKGLP